MPVPDRGSPPGAAVVGQVARSSAASAWRPEGRRLALERARLEAVAGLRLPATEHYRRPAERPFRTSERSTTTILIGGLTALHDAFNRDVFEGAGYRCEHLPTPDLECFHIGREHCSNGQCNPAYFTIGNLLRHLRQLEARGLSRRQIIDDYVFFTAGGGGPCRFGMYKSEYLLALRNAGFGGFRVLTFQQVLTRASNSASGITLSLNFGLAALKAFQLADALNDAAAQLRPYEVAPGETDRAVAECASLVSRHLRSFSARGLPPTLGRALGKLPRVRTVLNTIAKYRQSLRGSEYGELIARCGRRLNQVEVDRTRVRPIVKITGEFWAQTTEGDGNYRMPAFLESEDAELRVEPLGTWVMYLLFVSRERFVNRYRATNAASGRKLRNLLAAVSAQGRLLAFDVAERTYNREFDRIAAALGGLAHRLVPQQDIARLARPFCDPLARGGEGHQEVGKTIYYTTHRLSHMVLSLKPFGCLPSSQSDGIQAAIVDRYPELIFLPIETSGDGESQAHSRVQMVVADARNRARQEFDEALTSTGKSFDEIRAYLALHPELRRPFYRVPRQDGIIGVAANFVRHVSALMDNDRRAGASVARVPATGADAWPALAEPGR